jgi:hypothetical protein
MTTADYGAIFLMGLLGTGHCIGMCGAFALAASAGAGSTFAIVRRQLAYQAGKTLTYVFLAVVVALAGGWVAGTGVLPQLQTILGVGVGLFMVALGLGYALEFRWSARLARWGENSPVCAAAAAMLRTRTIAGSLLIGWLNGFLPCGLSLAAIVYAASFGSVVGAAAGAALFGLATLPGLLLVALVGQRAFDGSRRWLLRLAGATLVLMGLLTMVRGVPAVHAWFHAHTMLPGL